MLVDSGSAQHLGSSSPRLRFGEEPKAAGTWAGQRALRLDDEPAFELTYWCGTCPFLFRRLDGANERLSLEALRDRLAAGVAGCDRDVMTAFGQLLPEDDYLPLLLSVRPRLVYPVKEGDYFAEEQTATWGLDGFWGLPEYPHTPYYRTFETAVSPQAHLFEFVVPMTPPTWDDRDRIAEHAARLETSSSPTAVAVSTLDVAQPAMATLSTDYYEHWGLTHFLLDGHHKMHAAADTGRPLRLLSLVALGASLATSEQLAALPSLRAQPRTPRGER